MVQQLKGTSCCDKWIFLLGGPVVHSQRICIEVTEILVSSMSERTLLR